MPFSAEQTLYKMHTCVFNAHTGLLVLEAAGRIPQEPAQPFPQAAPRFKSQHRKRRPGPTARGAGSGAAAPPHPRGTSPRAGCLGSFRSAWETPFNRFPRWRYRFSIQMTSRSGVGRFANGLERRKDKGKAVSDWGFLTSTLVTCGSCSKMTQQQRSAWVFLVEFHFWKRNGSLSLTGRQVELYRCECLK